MNAMFFRMERPVIAVQKVLLLVVSFLALLGVNQSLAAGENSKYSVRSIKGCYIEALSGTVLPVPTNPMLQLPIASLIRFCADGKGAASVSATQNIAGACILEQTGEAEYSVDLNGTGTVTAILVNETVSPGCALLLTPGPQPGDTTIFTLRFGIQGPRGCLGTIGAGLVLPSGPIGYVAQGEACPQR